MIPETEWKFFEGTEQRVKHLARHQEENALAQLRGDPPPWDPSELAERQIAILQEMDYPARIEDEATCNYAGCTWKARKAKKHTKKQLNQRLKILQENLVEKAK